MIINLKSRNLNNFNKNITTTKPFVQKNEFFGTSWNLYEIKKREPKKHFCFNQFNNDYFINEENEKAYREYPRLRIESSKIKDVKKLNNAFKKENPVKVLKKTNSEKKYDTIASNTFHCRNKINTTLHTKFLGFENSSNKNSYNEMIKENKNQDNRNSQLLVFRRFSLYLVDLLKKESESKVNKSTLNIKRFEEKGNQAKMNIKDFQEIIQDNAQKLFDSIRSKQNYVYKNFKIREAYSVNFFEEILNNVYRKVYLINQNNEIMRVDYVINLIYNEIIEMTNHILDEDIDESSNKYKMKKKVIFSRSLNLFDIKESENINGLKEVKKKKVYGFKKTEYNYVSSFSRNNNSNGNTGDPNSNKNLNYKSNSPLTNSNADKILMKNGIDMNTISNGRLGNTFKSQISNSLKGSTNQFDLDINSINNKNSNLDSKNIHKKSKQNGSLTNNLQSVKSKKSSSNPQNKKSSKAQFSTLQTKPQRKKRKKAKNYSYSDEELLDSKGNIIKNIHMSNNVFVPTFNFVSPFKTIDTFGGKVFMLGKKILEKKQSSSLSSSKSNDDEINDQDFISPELLLSVKNNLAKRFEVELTVFAEKENKYVKKKFYRRGGIIIVNNDKIYDYEDMIDSENENKDNINKEKEEQTYKNNELKLTWNKSVYKTVEYVGNYNVNYEEDYEQFLDNYDTLQEKSKEDRLNAFYLNLKEFRAKSSERRRMIDETYKVVDKKPRQALNENLLFN